MRSPISRFGRGRRRARIDASGLDPGRVQDLLEKGKHIAAAIIDEGYPTSEGDRPFEKCDCWLCEKESLRFDHLQVDANPTSALDEHPVEADDTADVEADEDDDTEDAANRSGTSPSTADA